MIALIIIIIIIIIINNEYYYGGAITQNYATGPPYNVISHAVSQSRDSNECIL